MSEGQPQAPVFKGEAFSLPLSNGNKLTLVFHERSMTQRDYENIVHYLELLHDTLVVELVVPAGMQQGAQQPLRARIVTDEEASRTAAAIKIRENNYWAQKDQEAALRRRLATSSENSENEQPQ